MTAINSPKIVKKRILSPIWILPIIAFCLGGWLLFTHIQERGTEIEIHFPAANGMEANKTLVRYQGVAVGKVTAVDLSATGEVTVKVDMDHQISHLLNADTKFWLVRPKASITGIQGLDAVFSGNYIGMVPSFNEDSPKQTRFEGSFDEPLVARRNGRLTLELISDKRGSLDIGSGIYFHQVEVGQIIRYKLNPETQKIHFTAAIEPEYRSLVREDSQFWNSSGARVNAGLTGVEVELESLAALLAGGVNFSSPKDSPEISDNTSYQLHSSQGDTEPSFRITFNAPDAQGLSTGTAIRHRGLTLGKVIELEFVETGIKLTAEVQSEYRALFNDQTLFWRAGAQISLEGVKHLDTLIFGDFIALHPGNGAIKDEFILNSQRPELPNSGRYIQLQKKDNSGLSVGAPLLYNDYPVGEITQLTMNESVFHVTAWVDAPYDRYIGHDSKFWLHSGVKVKADLSGLQVQTAPLASLIKGGIAFSKSNGEPAPSEHQFTIHADQTTALEGPELTIKLFTSELNGLSVGAPLYYRELEVGKVSDIRLGSSKDRSEFTIVLSIPPKYRGLISSKSRFWHQSQIKVEGSLAGIKVEAGPIAQLLRGGLALGYKSNSKQSDRQIYADEQAALDPMVELTLFAKADARVGVNAAIRYLGHQIGKISAVALESDLRHQRLTAQIDRQWQPHFANQDSQFYLVSATVSLSGAKNLDTLVTGDYIAALPGKSKRAENEFTLLAQPPVYLPYDDGVRLVLNQPRLGSLKVGSPVLYRQVKVGEVIQTQLTADGRSVDIEIQLASQYQHLVNHSSRFWNASGVHVDVGIFSGARIATESIETILAGGIAFATEQASNAPIASGTRFTLASEADPVWLAWAPQF